MTELVLHRTSVRSAIFLLLLNGTSHHSSKYVWSSSIQLETWYGIHFQCFMIHVMQLQIGQGV
jgi:hypothetical protein